MGIDRWGLAAEQYLRGYEAGYRAAWVDSRDVLALDGAPASEASASEPARKRGSRKPGSVPTDRERDLGYHPIAPGGAPPAGRPAGTGSRQQAILDALATAAEEDSLPPTTVELADIMGSDARYLYRALPTLLRHGKVRCHTTSVEGVESVLEPGSDVTEARHLLGVAPRWSLANTKEQR